MHDHKTTTTEDSERNPNAEDEKKHSHERMGNIKSQENL
jgi:hypothetical protein